MTTEPEREPFVSSIGDLIQKVKDLEGASKPRFTPTPGAATLGEIDEMVRWWRGMRDSGDLGRIAVWHQGEVKPVEPTPLARLEEAVAEMRETLATIAAATAADANGSLPSDESE